MNGTSRNGVIKSNVYRLFEKHKEHMIKLSRTSFYLVKMEIFVNKVICHLFVIPDHCTCTIP